MALYLQSLCFRHFEVLVYKTFPRFLLFSSLARDLFIELISIVNMVKTRSSVRTNKAGRLSTVTQTEDISQNSRLLISWAHERLGRNNVSLEEVSDLWHYLMSANQHQCILNQLRGVVSPHHSPEAWTILEESLLRDLIDAWADFKRLVPSELSSFCPTMMSTATIVLLYCNTLERAKVEGVSMARSSGLIESEPFSHNPTCLHFDLDPPFKQVIEAFVDRVKCRKAHPEGLSLTMVVVLREMVEYVRELKGLILAIMPCLDSDTQKRVQNLDGWFICTLRNVLGNN